MMRRKYEYIKGLQKTVDIAPYTKEPHLVGYSELLGLPLDRLPQRPLASEEKKAVLPPPLYILKQLKELHMIFLMRKTADMSNRQGVIR
ncbi:hypothetical protein D3C80_1434210 [compost metagenome]